MNHSKFYTAVLLILVLVIAVLGFLILRRKAPEPAPDPTPGISDPVETQPPQDNVPDAPASTDSPTPTEEPVFETRPPIETEPPEETPEPTPTPVPEASGSFRSDTGTGLNIRADWYTLPGGTQIQVDVHCVSYSIYTAAQWHGVELTVGGQTYAADSKAVSYDGKDQITSPLASFTVDIPANDAAITVTWHYKGSYSGKEPSAITAAGVIRY